MQGAHGVTMSAKRRYRVRYTDEHDDVCPVFSYTCLAFSREHVEQRFYEAPDADGWKIVSIERVKEEHP